MYKVIIYELVIFKVKQTNRTIKKRYFKKLYTKHGINTKELTKVIIELHKKYKDSKYVINFVLENTNDWYIENLNRKSEKAYYNYVLGGYK